MAFRRRGYERDALLRAVIERVGFQDLAYDQSLEAEQEQELPLASLPPELAHFDLDRYRERPGVQAELVELLLLR